MVGRTLSPPVDARLSRSSNGNDADFQDSHGTFGGWDAGIRLTFLSFSMVCGAFVAYTTRHFVNGDAVAYFDMADAFVKRQWADVLNLHYSPGYAVLLGVVQLFSLPGSPHELFLAKAVNFLCYILALLALEALLSQMKKDEEFSDSEVRRNIGWVYFRAAAYGLFLLFALVYIRIQVVSPDMLQFCFVLSVIAVLIWIRKSSEALSKYVLLGLVTGFGYLSKTPFFPMSIVFISLSAFYCTSIRKAATRILVAAIVFLVVASPLFIPLSIRLGRLSFGESGSFNYSYFVSGIGQPVHEPERIWNKPAVDVYSGGSEAATYPKGFDLAYWQEGVTPAFDLRAQGLVFGRNLLALVDVSPWLYLAFLCWICFQMPIGASFSVKLLPPALPVLSAVIAAAGTALFCLVLLESRYIAPYVFSGFTAVLLWPRYGPACPRTLKAARVGVILLTALLIIMVNVSVWDQTARSLFETDSKQSHRTVFLENTAVKDFLIGRGVSNGQSVATLGEPAIGIYWARLAAVRTTAMISDRHDFLSASPQERTGAIDALRSRGFKAILATGESAADMTKEGWTHVPGTSSVFVLFLE